MTCSTPTKAIHAVLAALLMLAATLSPAVAQDKFKAVTTFTVIADMARNVAGDAAIVESITKPGAEIHNYQPTPGDIQQAQDAELILWNGLNLELWFEKFFQNLQGRAGRRRLRRRRADGHRRRPLHRQAQPACLDVADRGADLCRQHPRCLREVRSGQRRDLQGQCRGLQAEDHGGDRPDPGRARRDSRGASAGWCRARAPSAISPAISA